MLEKRNQRGSQRGNLVRHDIHMLHQIRCGQIVVPFAEPEKMASFMNVDSGDSGAFACAIIVSSSCSAARYSISVVTVPSFTRRYGVSMKPNSLTFACTHSDEIRPILGPSGVSIGQSRP